MHCESLKIIKACREIHVFGHYFECAQSIMKCSIMSSAVGFASGQRIRLFIIINYSKKCSCFFFIVFKVSYKKKYLKVEHIQASHLIVNC